MNALSFITRIDPQTGQPSPPDGKRKIFLSYKHSDEQERPLCHKLASYILERHDVAVWFDSQLTAGESYDEEIQKAIKEADAFVLILSRDILRSDYIWETEIPFAGQQQVAVIPILAGLSEADIPKVEEHLGRVHMPLWFTDRADGVPAFGSDALEQFHKGLAVCIANKDLLDQAVSFYEKGKHKVSLRHLTAEQIFAKAYGCLFGLDPDHDVTIGVRLMDSILHMYEIDKEFECLQEQVTLELLKHFYRTDQPELFFAYLQVALSRSFDVYTILYDVYHTQWHPELLCAELEASAALLKKLYRAARFDRELEQVMESTADEELREMASFPAVSEAERRHIGELHFDGHIAYFRRCPTDRTEAELVLDGRVLRSYDAQMRNMDTGTLFLGYDRERERLCSICAEFDHYGSETIYTCDVYRIDGDAIRHTSLYSEWVKGRHLLPYTPYVLGE